MCHIIEILPTSLPTSLLSLMILLLHKLQFIQVEIAYKHFFTNSSHVSQVVYEFLQKYAVDLDT